MSSASLADSSSLPPLSVYVHLPWCLAKCPYCDFNSHVAPAAIPEEQYIDCLLGDLDFDIAHVEHREVQSVFFGGGTPSLFSPLAIGRFLESLQQRLSLASDVEVTLEANPGALEYGQFAEYRNIGVTRISLGVQSFNDSHLKKLGRIHNRDAVFVAVQSLKAAGFDNFNLDLMYGLPEQTLEQAQSDLACAMELSPTHLSHYQLTMEPGTVFYHRPPQLPDEEIIWTVQQACQQQLVAAGFQQYEVSAYAREGYQCRHNRNYWEFGDYLGLGAGAHGKWTRGDQEVFRTVRVKQPREYLEQRKAEARVAENNRVDRADLPFEFMLNALRLRQGFAPDLFERHTGLSIASIDKQLLRAAQRGLLVQGALEHWLPSDLGYRFLNDLQAMFLRDR